MSLWKRFRDELKDVQEQMDLKKKYPNYFHKRIFQGVIVAMILFTIFIFITQGKTLSFVYAECNKDVPCKNPFYVCSDSFYSALNKSIHNNFEFQNKIVMIDCIPKNNIPKEIKPLCNAGLCDNETLAPHQIIGVKPSKLVLWYNPLCLLIVALGFLINHITYKVKRK